MAAISGANVFTFTCRRLLPECSYYLQYGGVRWRRRTTVLAPWRVRPKPDFIEQNLTNENREFLKNYTEDFYKNSLPTSALQNAPEATPLKEQSPVKATWTPNSIRTGLLCKKLGVLPQWTKEGKLMYCTLLQVQDNYVVGYTDPETWHKTSRLGKKFGKRVLGRLTVGVNPGNPQDYTAQYRGLFNKAGLPPAQKLATFAISPDAKIEPGTRIPATHFTVGQRLDLWGHTIERGFQGVMKRWGFKGGPATHGATKFHRRPGSIGNSGEACVKPAKPMPGHMGSEWRSLIKIKLLRINTKHQVLYVQHGAVMGEVGSYVYVRDTRIFPSRVKNPPFPTHYVAEDTEPLAEDIFDESLFQMSQPTIAFPESEEKTVRSTGGVKVKKQSKVKKA